MNERSTEEHIAVRAFHSYKDRDGVPRTGLNLNARLDIHRRMSSMLGLMEEYYPTLFTNGDDDKDVVELLAIMPRIVTTRTYSGTGFVTYTSRMLDLEGNVMIYSETYPD